MEATEVCFWCGTAIQLDPNKGRVWVHRRYLVLTCRDQQNELMDPMHFAEPVEWEVCAS